MVETSAFYNEQTLRVQRSYRSSVPAVCGNVCKRSIVVDVAIAQTDPVTAFVPDEFCCVYPHDDGII